MTYYIAQRSPKTDQFQLWQKDGKPHKFNHEAEAINNYKSIIQLEGTKNVILLKEVDTILKLKVHKAK